MTANKTRYHSFQAGVILMQRALAGETTRVPVYAQMHEFVAREMNIPGRQFYSDATIMVPAMLEAQLRYEIDVPSITYDVYNIEAEALGQKLVWNDDNAPDIDRSTPLIQDNDDLTLIRTPDFETEGRFTNVIRMHKLFYELTGIQPTLSFCAPFTLAANLRGIEQLLLDIHTDPAFARELLNRLTNEVLAPWILHQKQCFPFATSISGADAIASLPIINMHILREWALPYILNLRALCGPEVYVANWVGESYLQMPEEMLDLKRIAYGQRRVLGQDPDVERLGPEYYKAYAERCGLPLVLGIGARFLAESTPMQVAERVRRYVAVGARSGRFALYLCNVGATTPAENLIAAVKAAHGAG